MYSSPVLILQTISLSPQTNANHNFAQRAATGADQMVPKSTVPPTEMTANELRDKLLREKVKASRLASASDN